MDAKPESRSDPTDRFDPDAVPAFDRYPYNADAKPDPVRDLLDVGESVARRTGYPQPLPQPLLDALRADSVRVTVLDANGDPVARGAARIGYDGGGLTVRYTDLTFPRHRLVLPVRPEPDPIDQSDNEPLPLTHSLSTLGAGHPYAHSVTHFHEHVHAQHGAHTSHTHTHTHYDGDAHGAGGSVYPQLLHDHDHPGEPGSAA